MKHTKSEYTIGIDLGDNTHEICVLDADANIAETLNVENTKEALSDISHKYPYSSIIIEAGCHSPWISRLFEANKHNVIVANPRKVRAIYDTDNKNDQRDAELLARIGRFDPKLLSGIKHKSEDRQRSLIKLKSRDILISSRTKLINSVRGSLKSIGIKICSNTGADVFALRARDELDEDNICMLDALLESIR